MESTPVRCAETMHHRKRRDILAYFVVALVTLASVCDGFVVRSVSLPSRRHDLTSIFDAGAAAAVSTETNGGSTRRRRPRHRKDSLRGLKCLTQIPSGKDPYAILKKQTAEATQAAMDAGVKLIELEFPPVRGKLDISLGETLDANRVFARELARSFSARMGKELWLVFPDDAEAELAAKTYGGTTFRVVGIQSAIKNLQEEDCKMQIVINPGFNVEEWIVLEKLARPDVPMVMLNGGLDKLRGGYYPRIFYPGLYNAKERFLKNFETMYYLKALPGGWIFRKAPEDWQIVSMSQEAKRGQKAVSSRVLTSTADRPEYNKAIKIIQAAAREAQQGAADDEEFE
eukprot:jgi/Undpi1/2115/HiC_scaffold_12.g05501.m1